MSKPFRLQPILELAAREAEKSAMLLGNLTRHAAEVESKLGLLIQYREEYVSRYRKALQDENHDKGHENFHQFMDRLDAAITQQQAVVADARQQLRLGQAEHLNRQRRLKAFDTLSARHAAAERQAAERSELKTLDEITGNVLRQRTRAAQA